VHAFLRDATVRDVQSDEIVLLFRNSFHADSTSAQPELLVEALHEVLGGTWRVRVELGGDERARESAAPAVRTGDDPVSSTGATEPSAAGGEWPEITRPGGAAPAGTPAQGRAASTRSGAGRQASKPARSGRSAPSRGGQVRDDGPPDEPPFDPDGERAAYGGFDPGDEPLDDGTPAVRESSEAQAIRAVTEVFAVERLGDTPPRS
jgi:DNA polymerase-3 subunit gamma/tau